MLLFLGGGGLGGIEAEVEAEVIRARLELGSTQRMLARLPLTLEMRKLEDVGPSTPRGETEKGVHAEHESLLHAIRDKNSEGARTAVRAHLSNSIDRLKMRRSAER